MEMSVMREWPWLFPVCFTSVCGWWCTRVAVENRLQYKWAGALNWCLWELHSVLCSTLGTILLWMGLECLKVWYFSARALLLSYVSNVGRDQEGSETCLNLVPVQIYFATPVPAQGLLLTRHCLRTLWWESLSWAKPVVQGAACRR